jgi:hypothetical protein
MLRLLPLSSNAQKAVLVQSLAQSVPEELKDNVLLTSRCVYIGRNPKPQAKAEQLSCVLPSGWINVSSLHGQATVVSDGTKVGFV